MKCLSCGAQMAERIEDYAPTDGEVPTGLVLVSDSVVGWSVAA